MPILRHPIHRATVAFSRNPMKWVHRTFCHNAIIVQGCLQEVISVCFNGRADQNGFRNELNYTPHLYVFVYFFPVFFFFFYANFVFSFLEYEILSLRYVLRFLGLPVYCNMSVKNSILC